MVRPKGRAVRSKARPVEIPKAPPPDDPYSPQNLIGKCKRCVGTGELYVVFSSGKQVTRRCDLCGGSGLDETEEQKEAMQNLLARVQQRVQQSKINAPGAGGMRSFITTPSKLTQAPPTPEQLAASISGPFVPLEQDPEKWIDDLFDEVNDGENDDAGWQAPPPAYCTTCSGSGFMETGSGYVGCPSCRGTGKPRG